MTEYHSIATSTDKLIFYVMQYAAPAMLLPYWFESTEGSTTQFLVFLTFGAIIICGMYRLNTQQSGWLKTLISIIPVVIGILFVIFNSISLLPALLLLLSISAFIGYSTQSNNIIANNCSALYFEIAAYIALFVVAST
jgi:uncharacterized membrane protein YdfJ with MMPL/SSD domain